MKLQGKFLCVTIALSLLSGCGQSTTPIANTRSIDEQFTIIEKAIGESFNAVMEISKEEAIDKYRISEANVEDIRAQMAMVSMHIDQLVIVRAKEGSVEKVKKELDDYRQALIDDTMQYPMNIPFIQGSIVKVIGNDVYFIMQGIYDDTFMDLEEEEAIKEVQKRNQDALNAIT